MKKKRDDMTANPVLFNALKSCSYFSSLTDAELRDMEAVSRIVTLPAGRLLFREGDPPYAFYIVLSGQIELFKTSPDGKKIILRLFGRDEVFAEPPALGYMPAYPANALCLEDCKLLSVDGKKFKVLSRSKPEIHLKMQARLADRLCKFNGLIEDLSLRSVDSRLAKYLLSICDNPKGKAVIRIQKKTLAAILGTIPETLSRTFKRLSTEGIIDVQDQTIEILNKPALEALSRLG